MYLKKIIARPLILFLTVSQCMTAYAGTWACQSQNEWKYQNDDGTYQKGGWFQDPADGHRYYLMEDGVIMTGWIYREDTWYYLNTVHDGLFGAALTDGWHWIDGYCYYFDQAGKMYREITTPDGFLVDENGRWTENGVVVFVKGKGIQNEVATGTAMASGRRSSGGGGSGGSGSGGGGNSSKGNSSADYYGYSVYYVEENGSLLETLTGEALKNSFVEIEVREYPGYVFLEGENGKQKLTSDNASYTLIYRKENHQNTELEVAEQYGYTIHYIDSSDGKELKVKKGLAEKGSWITVFDVYLSGYEAHEGNNYAFSLSEDNMDIYLYYTKQGKTLDYTIRYIGSDGMLLGSVEGKAPEESVVDIPDRWFDGYAKKEGQRSSFVLTSDVTVVKVLYEKEPGEEVATPSEPEEKDCAYIIEYIDMETSDLILKETGRAKAGDAIVPDHKFEDYEYAADYEFVIEAEWEHFTVYLIAAEESSESVIADYTVLCIDENGIVIKVYTGKISVGDEPVKIEPDYDLQGYELVGDNVFYVSKDGINEFSLHYTQVEDVIIFTVECVDIDTMAEITRIVQTGRAGESLDISSICPNGYQKLGNPPDSVEVSENALNNYIRIYFKRITESTETLKERAYTIRFRAYGDEDTKILNDIAGYAAVGEKLPVYFVQEVVMSDGQVWSAIGDSPRLFTVRDQAENVFLIEYNLTAEESPDNSTGMQSYTIRYIAEDTGSVLGVTTGFANVGDSISYDNWFQEYGFKGSTHLLVVMEGDNRIDVPLVRIKYPGHEVNGATGKYDGCEWNAIFIDEEGRQLLPSVSGFTVDGDLFYIGYPETIESEGVTYRAVEAGPYKSIMEGTVYRQFLIHYTSGDSSAAKLDYWKEAAQKKKDEFYGTQPYSFLISYKEKNSWNDIGLKLGVANAGTQVNIECEEIDGWMIPNEHLGEFILEEDGQKAAAQYERADSGTSAGYIKREYTISFEDESGETLFAPYTGFLAFPTGNGSCELPVFYPNSFYDSRGNRYEAETSSPQWFTMSALESNNKTVRFRRVFENPREQFVVTNNADVNRLINELAVHTYDSIRHEFYFIGRNFTPNTAEVSDTIYANNLSEYTNEVVDTFDIDGVKYTVTLLGFYRNWAPESCTHEWEYLDELTGECLTATTQVVRCKKCRTELTTILPAVGHTDINHDSICDTCGLRLKQILGDEITVTWDSGTLGFGTIDFDFVCIDTDYNGTGNMLYICEDDISSELYGAYTTSDSADYGSSQLKYFLDDPFANGLSVRNVLQDIEGCAASILTKEEFDIYKINSLNNYPFPSGRYLTKGNGNTVVLTDGSEIPLEDASQYPVRPVILLSSSQGMEENQTGTWKLGDYQARSIGDKLYVFRCVHENYMDDTNTDKGLALFLCDALIPANEGLGFEGEGQTQATRFFGDNNNYKYSLINDWLEENKSGTGDLINMNIGIRNEYSGKTTAGKFQNMDEKALTRHRRDTPQVMYSNLFIPSVEEAIALKDFLWKFNRSETNNANEMINGYCNSYWLRTPVYGTDDMIYTVNLSNGTIEPKAVNGTEGNAVSNTGIRPMYAVQQTY